MSYESWRISYQSSEQAARAAYAKVEELAARLAELEGQEPVGEVIHSDVLSGEGGAYRHELLCDFRLGVQTELYARPVPAEQPVNARLLTAAKAAVAFIEGKPDAVEPFGLLREAISAAEAQQERLLQDMHDAGREIDRVMAESAPKAVRLTQEEIKTVLKVNTLSSLVMRICRSIETAVLERNGLKPQAKGQGDHAASRGPWV